MNDAKGMEVSFMVKAVQTYKTRKKGELNFKKNQLIHVSKTNEAEFVYYGHYHGKQGYQSGWFPYFYVKSLDGPSKAAVDPNALGEEENIANNSSAAPSISSAIPTFDSRARREKHSSITRKSRNKILFSNDGSEEIAKRMDEQYVLKSGMISKRSQTNPALWKPLWMVLRPSHLAYFKSAVDKKPLGKLSVDTMKSVSIENGLGDSSQLYCFAINSHSKKHALILSASTLHECEDWMAMLEFAIKGGKPVTAAEQLLKKEERKEEGINAAEIQKLIFTRPKEIILHPDLSHPEYLDHILPRPDEGEEEEEEEGDKPPLQLSKRFRLPSLPSSLFLKVPVIGKVRAIRGHVGRSVGEMTFRANDEWYLIERRQEEGWWLGYAKDQFGFFPSSSVLFLHPLSIDLQSLVDSLTPPDEEEGKGGEKAEGKGGEGKGSEERDYSPSLDRRRPEKHTTLLQNYQVGELLGVGGFGSVYRGIDVETGVMVAIKQVDLDRVNKKELQTIMGELNLLKVLDHINIVQYKGFIKTADHINIILDFVEGGSLFSLLNKFGPMHGDLVIRYIKQILEGLDYLHSQSVVHNDIKCGNILITKSGVVKLADFGIASLGENADQNVAGSPYWMAPEVIELRGTSPASDIWSLGCTIVELLKGQPPFFELNKMQALFAIVENDIPPLPPNLPPKMEDFLRKCFNKEPSLRPTAKQLLTHPLLCATSSDSFNDEDDEEDEEEDEEEGEEGEEGGEEGDTPHGAPSLPSTQTPTSSSFDSSGDEEEDDDEEEEESEEESEEEMQLRREEKDAKELLGWFKAAVDKGNTTHITRLRKAVRQKLLHLRLLRSSDPRYRSVYFLVRNELQRVDLQFVDQIPVDPAEAAEYENDSDFEE